MYPKSLDQILWEASTTAAGVSKPTCAASSDR